MSDDELLQDLGGVFGSSQANVPKAAKRPAAAVPKATAGGAVDLTFSDDSPEAPAKTARRTLADSPRRTAAKAAVVSRSTADRQEDDLHTAGPSATFRPTAPARQHGGAMPGTASYRQPSSPPAKKGGKLSPEEKARRADARKADQEAKKAAKERDKADKAAERERKKLEKQAAAAANKEAKGKQRTEQRRASGKTAEEDVKLRLDPLIMSQPDGPRFLSAVVNSKYQHDFTQSLPLAPLRTCRWQWRIHAKDGSPETWEDVPYVAVLLTGEEYVQLTAGEGLADVVRRSARLLPGCTLCFVVSGLESHLTRMENQQWRASGPSGSHDPAVQRARSMTAAIAVRWPGVRLRLMVDADAAADHIIQLTRAMAEQPFCKQDAFLGDFGGSKSSEAKGKLMDSHPLPPDKRVMFNALIHVPDVGPAQAHAIAEEYGSFGNLIANLLDPSAHAQSSIADMVRTGGSRRVGPAAADKLFRILCSEDPNTRIAELPG